MSYALTTRGGCVFGQFSLFSEAEVVHGVSTRHGGVSRPPYDTLNLALHVGDGDADVIENRRRFMAALGLDFERLTTPEQVHGEAIFRVTGAEAGRGRLSYADAVPQTDALMTDVPGLPLMLCYADCTPILLYDPVRRATAIAHGGWKGTVRAIAAKTVRAMRETFGTRPEDCLAAIGPAIGPCCYEIGSDVAAAFRAAFPGDAESWLAEKNGGYRLDLRRANRDQLEQAGLRLGHIETADVCTACHADTYYSYRAAGGATGRIAAIISIR